MPTDILSTALDGFDYHVDCDDFILYEIARLIEEDRASLDDEDFSRAIDEGIDEHVGARLEIRAELALRLRGLYANMDDEARPVAARVLQAVENIEFPLRNVGLVLRTYTAYVFRRLEECAGKGVERDGEARDWINRWQSGEVLREDMSKHLKAIGPSAVAPLADLLFDSPDDRMAVEAALDILGSIRSPISARILAHAVSEPMLQEELEARAYALVRAMWPLPRHYIVYSLKAHEHEDIPFRWLQLLVDCNETDAVDRILEEILVHAKNPDLHEDLLAAITLLEQAKDPDTEEKIVQVLNSPDTPQAAVEILEGFLKTSKTPPRTNGGTAGPWSQLARLQAANKKYLAAAKLFDTGRKADSLRKLDELLKEDSGYPFALMLRRLI